MQISLLYSNVRVEALTVFLACIFNRIIFRNALNLNKSLIDKLMLMSFKKQEAQSNSDVSALKVTVFDISFHEIIEKEMKVFVLKKVYD